MDDPAEKTVAGRPPPGSSGIKKSVKKLPASGSFEVLPPEDGKPAKVSSAGSEGRTPSRTASSPVRGSSAGRMPSGRRSNTPTKQVSLQAVKRKEEKDEALGDFNWEEHQKLEEERFKKMNGHTAPSTEGAEGAVGGITSDVDKLRLAEASSQEGSTDADSDSDEEEEKIKAPNDLICEFLSCIMDNDWENAKKLCKMILIYEPDHKEALQYQALIDEMIRQEEEEESDDSEEDTDDDDEDDDEDDDDDDDEDGSESSAAESADEAENKKEAKSNQRGDTTSTKWQPTNL